MEQKTIPTQSISARLPLPLYLRLSAEVVRRRNKGEDCSRGKLLVDLLSEHLPGIEPQTAEPTTRP